MFVFRHVFDPGRDMMATIQRQSDGMTWDGTNWVPPGPTAKQWPLLPLPMPWLGVYSANVDIPIEPGWVAYSVYVHFHFVSPTGPILGAVRDQYEIQLYAGSLLPPPPAIINISAPPSVAVVRGS